MHRFVIFQRRPLLIYIHHKDKMLDLLGCEFLIEFLRENYIVWPWDISNESNRQLYVRYLHIEFGNIF
jgi:hypothetical protein